MNWDSIISISIAAIGVGISIWAFIEAKKANKAVLQQNREKELADIDKEIVEINAKIERLKVEGEEKNSHIYGFLPNPYQGTIDTLKQRKDSLLNRKQQIRKQLK
ncbi:MAG: hypothetical protein IJX48_07235 [Paludibacteraceae bacterium]|nr:hypothetical protein [Paludibacteraceae bacterium]